VGCDTPGEIAIQSRYIALGYWREPELTRRSFLPDPQGGEQRLYCTGDLGRLRPDACLEHLGRKDAQVKIRGNRGEVVEVEMALLALDAVKEVVVTRHDRHHKGGEILVAMWCLQNSLDPQVVNCSAISSTSCRPTWSLLYSYTWRRCRVRLPGK
jgi:acyl-coenzyme A synthetase/AMP-(fatty) acid ligase